MNDIYLAHHGILGQKWGVRRYQEESGELTPEGQTHRFAREKKPIDGMDKLVSSYEKVSNVNAAVQIGMLAATGLMGLATKKLNSKTIQAGYEALQKLGKKLDKADDVFDIADMATGYYDTAREYQKSDRTEQDLKDAGANAGVQTAFNALLIASKRKAAKKIYGS